MIKPIVALALLFFSNHAFAVYSQQVVDRLNKNYDPRSSIKVTPAGQSAADCEIYDIRIKTVDPVSIASGRPQSHVIKAREYLPPGVTDRRNLKSVILIPPIVGENPIDRLYANSLCTSGMRVALLQSWTEGLTEELDLGSHDRGAERALSAVRHLADYLTHYRPGKKIGILGTSLGGIISALATGFDDRIGSAVLIVGGGGMSEIISRSNEQSLTVLRGERFQRFGYTSDDAYQAALAPYIKIDPLDFAPRVARKKKVLMIIAKSDETVPTKNQWELYRAFGSQELITYFSDHYNTILHSAVWFRSSIVNFLVKNVN